MQGKLMQKPENVTDSSVQHVRISVEKFFLKKCTKMVNRMWRNNSLDIMTSVCCAAEISTEVSMPTG